MDYENSLMGVDFNLLSVVTFVFHLPSVAMVEPAHCRKCSVCPRGYIEKQACTLTNNTACEQCSVGTFQDRRGGGCKECSKCGKGEFVRRPCRPYKNTICKACPDGTFSDDGSRWACKYCQRCLGYQIELQQCTQTQDATCGEGFVNKLDREERGDNPEEDLEYNVHTRVTLRYITAQDCELDAQRDTYRHKTVNLMLKEANNGTRL
ncbi:TNR16-like protein [Mya arenaria]|uniref:TNR16-like protein n=1 Tax=Mya arenaria TaxID=6604 RepID=A0ABY7FD49_MYAAR|nr:TNR16-like protein [Mya arenaria]